MADFRAAVLAGLARAPRTIPARYFYDADGSRLFEEITRLPEYYPTATEIGILSAAAPELGAALGRGAVLVELGSGSSAKTPPLLSAMQASAYVPIDISPTALVGASAMLVDNLPDLMVHPVAADFLHDWALPAEVAGKRLVGFFPGSTIGNLAPAAAVDLLRHLARKLGAGAALVIGIDRRKDAGVLERAYDDAAGVTAAFNKNLLHRMVRELGAELEPDAFDHRARWCDPPGRIEMHLVANRRTAITIGAEQFDFFPGEGIHTENSYKYSPEEAAFLARAGGWEPEGMWTDFAARFMVQLWRAAGDVPQP